MSYGNRHRSFRILLFPHRYALHTQLNIPLYISAEDEQIVKVSIWDLSGKQKKIIQKQYTPGLSILELDIADLPKGFYILTAEIDQMQFSQKLIKE